MAPRTFWLDRIADAWARRPVVWLTGVRRSGKTTLCRGLDDVAYFDCELPSVRKALEDPESFLADAPKKRVALDEVHRLPDPANVLKIAADHFPKLRIVATGSSTLQAGQQFRDTLTGRKTEILLTPMIEADRAALGDPSVERRLLHGGLPPFFLADRTRAEDFAEWIDSYFAKDVLGLFRLDRRAGFLKLVELIFAQSGGIFEAAAFAAPCEISRNTVASYLDMLTATHVATVVRPFSTRRATEIVGAPRVYGFDTGFVAHYRGWTTLRAEDRGALFEHLVLNELKARLTDAEVRYWRDKSGREIDFVVVRRGKPPITIEAKSSADAFDGTSLNAFRAAYPEGEDFVVALDVVRPYRRTVRGRPVRFVPLSTLPDALVG